MAAFFTRRLILASRLPNVTADNLATIVRTANMPGGNPNIFSNIPSSAFRQTTNGQWVTATGRSLDDFEFTLRSGRSAEAARMLGVTNIPSNQLTSLDNTFAGMFPDRNISNIADNRQAVEQLARSRGSNVTNVNNARNATDIERVLNQDPVLRQVQPTLSSRLVQGSRIVLATGAVVIVGAYLYQTIADAIAANSGCFYVVQESPGSTRWFRVVSGYACGNIRGDNLWLIENPDNILQHPFRESEWNTYIQCEDEGSTCVFCSNEQLAEAGIDIENIPDNATFVCRQSTIFDVLGDIAGSIGDDIFDILGSITAPIFGNSLFRNIIIIASGLVGGFLTTFVTRNSTNRAIKFITPVVVTIIIWIFFFMIWT